MSSAFQIRSEVTLSPCRRDLRLGHRPGWRLSWLVCQLVACLCVLLFGAAPAGAAPISSAELPGGETAGSDLPDSDLPDSDLPDSNLVVELPVRVAADEAPDAPAPMCAPDGASVAAAEEIPELDRGRFEALPCEAQLMMAGWRPDAPEFGCKASSFENREAPPPSPHRAPRPRDDGARELGVPFPVRAAPSSLTTSPCYGLAPSRGHSRNLFRPPVARARG